MSRSQPQAYTIVSISSITRNISTIDALFYWKHQNPHLSNKVTAEYIENLKNTSQCKRMWIQTNSQKSLIISQNRGRLANQLSSFALPGTGLASSSEIFRKNFVYLIHNLVGFTWLEQKLFLPESVPEATLYQVQCKYKSLFGSFARQILGNRLVYRWNIWQFWKANFPSFIE